MTLMTPPMHTAHSSYQKSESARLDLDDDIKRGSTSPLRVDSPTNLNLIASFGKSKQRLKMIGIALLGAGIFARERTSPGQRHLTQQPLR